VRFTPAGIVGETGYALTAAPDISSIPIGMTIPAVFMELPPEFKH